MTIRNKLLLTYLAPTVFGLSLLVAYLVWSYRAFFYNSAEEDLAARATAISESVADWLELGDLERVNTVVQRYGAQPQITLRVFDKDAHLLSSSEPDDVNVKNWLHLPGIQAALKNQSSRGVARGLVGTEPRLYEARPLFRHGRLLGAMRISLSLEHFRDQVEGVVKTVMGLLFLTLALCAFFSAWIARNIAIPIQGMRNFAVRLGSGHLGEKLSIPRRDELGELAIELNRMSERLAKLDDERRSFLANVSHELRTPVSNVQVTLEALESGADEEPELRTRFIRTALEETNRLSRLIQDLLDLGRLEAGVMQLEHQSLRLRHLIEQGARAMESRLRAKGMSIHMELEDVQVFGDSERLLQAFFNVLDNAIKFSPTGSSVYILGRAEAASISVLIQDHGSGIGETDLPHVFEQFYTADPSRRRGGTGLGLAIARRIVESHGGTISASSMPGRGATFVIRLPIVERGTVPTPRPRPVTVTS